MSDVTITYTTGTRAEREATTPTASMLWYETDYGQWAFWDTAEGEWILLPITAPADTTIGELTAVTEAADDDVLILKQSSGLAKKITTANLLAPVTQAAGTVIGTRAERETATPDGPQLWYESDYEMWWHWAAATGVWRQILDLAVEQSGIIEGLQISRAGSNLIQIEPGVLQILGERFYLDAAITKTVTTNTAYGWMAIRTGLSRESSRALTSASFSVCALNIQRGPGGVWWHGSNMPGDVEEPWLPWFIVGLYPYVNDDVIDFYTVGGKYILNRECINDAAPPTSATSYSIGLPNIGEPLVGHYLAEAEAAASSIITLNVDSAPVLGLSANDGSVGVRNVQGPVMIPSADGTADFHLDVDSGGSASQLTLTLQAVDVPAGMAR